MFYFRGNVLQTAKRESFNFLFLSGQWKLLLAQEQLIEASRCILNLTIHLTQHIHQYICLEKLQECQIYTYVKLQSSHIPMKLEDKTVKTKLETLERLITKYRLGEIYRIH